jgi:hypothetical protein
MAEKHEGAKKALGAKHDREKEKSEHEGGEKLHTHGVHYERAGNGGVIAHVHRHTGKPGVDHAHHHTEEHVLPDTEAAQAHLDEHMGDQPAAGEMEPAQATAPPPPPEMAGAGAGAAPGGM